MSTLRVLAENVALLIGPPSLITALAFWFG
jgi:hypothetical protein